MMREIMDAGTRTTVRLGRLTIAFEGMNKISRHVVDELAVALPPSHDAPRLIFRFVTAPPRRKEGVRIDSLRGVIVDLSEKANERTYEVAPRRMAPDFVPGSDLAIKALEMNYLTLDELRAKNFVYKLFNWAVQLEQLELGQSFIHASAITKSGRTLAVLGEGGVGKTSAMLKLCLEDGWRYLSDDLAVIDDSGIVYRSPARLQVYAYNTKGDANLERRLLRERGVFDRLQWSLRRRLLGRAKVRRRVSAEFLFGAGGVAESAELNELVFLERAKTPGLTWKDMTPLEAAARMAPIIMNEIKAYAGVYAELGEGPSGTLPSLGKLEARTRDVLGRAFSRVSTRLMTAGPEIVPPDLARALR
jgi:hypothetical protein